MFLVCLACCVFYVCPPCFGVFVMTGVPRFSFTVPQEGRSSPLPAISAIHQVYYRHPHNTSEKGALKRNGVGRAKIEGVNWGSPEGEQIASQAVLETVRARRPGKPPPIHPPTKCSPPFCACRRGPALQTSSRFFCYPGFVLRHFFLLSNVALPVCLPGRAFRSPPLGEGS